MRASNRPARPWRITMALVLTLLLLTSTTGCSKHYVVVDGEQTVTVKKATLDHLYQDNEQLLQALEACRHEH